MQIPRNDWLRYIEKLSKINQKAADLMTAWIDANGYDNVDAMVAYASGLTQRYGEAAAALACEMYDAVAEAAGVTVLAAEAAEVFDQYYIDKAVRGKLKEAPTEVPSLVGRMVKQAGADTTLKNARRDGAQFAWVPHGDTCAFCITLASRGWQYQSKKAIKGGHAEHIHSNCDCTYAIRFNDDDGVAGYDPEKYAEMYYGADGNTPEEKINAMRREQYKADRDEINARKRAAYERAHPWSIKNARTFENGDAVKEYFGIRPDRTIRKEDREKYEQMMREYRMSMFGSWEDSLSSDEIASIRYYTGDSYIGINGLLRDQMTENMVNAWNSTSPRTIQSMISDIDTSIDEFELKDTIKVFRTCENDVLENLKLEVGKTFKDNGFSSTSALSKKVASGNIVMEINVPSGKGHGAWVNPISGAEDEEYEFLLPRGSSFRVTDVKRKGDDTVVSMDWIGAEKEEYKFATKDEVIERWNRLGIEYTEDEAARL